MAAFSANGFHSNTKPSINLSTLTATGHTSRARVIGIEGATIDGSTSTLAPGASGTLLFAVENDDTALVEASYGGRSVYLSMGAEP